MKKFYQLLVASAAFLCLPTAGFSAPALKVLSAAPKGFQSASGRQAVSVTFNKPVAALSEDTAFSVEDCPLQVTPSVPGTCRFVGTQTLQFEPLSDWPVATRFIARVRKGFASRVSAEQLANPYTFSFTTQTPQVQAVYPQTNEHWISLNPTLYVVFNMPVNVKELSKYASLTADGHTTAVSARPITEEEYTKNFSYIPSAKQVVALLPTQPLQSGRSYTLRLAQGLKALDGEEGMAQAHTSTFFTYPALTVQGTLTDGCLPYTPGVRFSSPVRLRELISQLEISPATALRKLSDSELDALGNEVVIRPENLSKDMAAIYKKRYNVTDEELKQGAAFFFMPLSFLELKAGQPVTLRVSKNLRDIYGQTLGQDVTITVQNSGYCPAAEFAGGFGVLESYLPARLPIEVMNLPILSVRAARFNKENFIPFAQQNSRYCQPKALDNPTFNGPYTLSNVRNKSLRTFFDLSLFKPSAKDSIVFTQVKLPRSGAEDDCWTAATTNLTDVGLTLKTSPSSILIWATSLETGSPMPNLEVELRDTQNTIVWSGSTDMNGLARAPGWKELDVKVPSWGQPKLYAFASSLGGDGVVTTEFNEGIEPWRFNLDYEYNPQSAAMRVSLFTERGIYRPGETVYLKGVSRRLQKGAWALPKGQKGTLVVSDVTGQEIVKKEVAISNDMGTFNESFKVPASAHTGMWDVSFTPAVPGTTDPSSYYTSFRVEAVKQADFKVTLLAQQQNYLSGQEANFAGSAVYNFGAPLAQVPAKWTLKREMAWFEPKGFNDYTFTPYFLRQDEYRQNGQVVLSSSGKTDDKGAFSFAARLPQVQTPTQVYAEADVQSPARQNLFARTSVMVHPASFYLGTKVLTEDARAGQPVQVEVIALTTDGQRTDTTNVVAQIRKIQWYSVRKVGLSGRLEWVSERQEQQLPSQTFDVSAKGSTFSFTPQEGGNYQVTLVSADAQGHQVLGGFDVMVYGEGEAYWQRNDHDILTLKQDKNTYKPGQKARISLESPYENALALVTVEREGILDAWTTYVKGGADYVEVPIKENYLPNVYVSVTLVRGRSGAATDEKGVDLGKPQGKVGYVNLTVEPASKRLNVEVKTNRTQFRPGEEVTVKLTTKSGRKGVPAEVVLWAVDEGMLALTNYKRPDLFKEFYGDRPISVFTADNRAYVIGQRNFGEKGENRGGGGGANAKLGGADLRSNFSFVPYFNAIVKTDAKGRAEVSFKLPDNLTKFRIFAVAVRTDEFGAGETEVKVSKPLMITPNLPRFARKADRFSCGAVVYNYEDKKGQLTVSAQATGALQLAGPAVQGIYVPLGQAKAVYWPCVADQNGKAQVKFEVKGAKSSDGVLTDISVQSIEKPQTLALYAATDSKQKELLDKPGHLDPQAANEVKIALSSTALLNLKGSLVYLWDYPYDCLEQLMSKILPVVEGSALLQDFKLADTSELRTRAQAILDRIAQYQHTSGGFGYWPDSQPDPYVTAYTLDVCERARQAGFTVPTAELQKAANWLETAFNKNQVRAYSYSSYETDITRAYSVYVLMMYGKHMTAPFNTLYAQRNSLPVPAVAYLLKAAHQSNRSEAFKQALAQQLLNKAVHTPQSVYFTVPVYLPWIHINDVTTTALALDAFLQTKQPFAQAFQTVTWLLQQLNAQGHWDSTTNNAAVFQALQRYYQTQETAVPDFEAQANVNGQTVLSPVFKGRSVEEVEAIVPFAQAYADGSETYVNLSKNGVGTLYYSLAQTYQPLDYDKPVQAGFSISRAITALDGSAVKEIVAGERYHVTLTVNTPADRHFVVVEDFVPAGFEIVNTSLATESAQQAQQLAGKNRWFYRSEKYDDHIAAFADYLPAGEHTYTYTVSVLAEGEFAYPAAWASLLYEPAVFGRTATSEVTVR